MTYALESTPLRVFGLSHLMVVEKMLLKRIGRFIVVFLTAQIPRSSSPRDGGGTLSLAGRRTDGGLENTALRGVEQ